MNNRGFTLIEVLVALVISGLLAGVTFQLVRGQERFVGMQSAREEVQQNGRATLELISAELRGVNAEGIDSAGTDYIRFRIPRAWGLVCGAGATAGSMVVVFPGTDLSPFRSGTANADSLAVRDSTPGLATRYSFSPVADATPTAGSGAALCPGLTPDAGRVQVRTLTGVPASFPVQLGEPVYLYDVVAYDVGTSNVPGDWLRRKDSGTAQPLAGPLGTDAAGPVFRLRYYNAAGAEIVQPLDAADRASIASIQIRVTAASRSSNPRQEFSDSTRVHLRN